MTKSPPTPATLGLALSGGTAKVIAHLGVLEALERADLRPHRLAGTSGGSLIAVLYAAGMSLADIARLAEDVTWKRLATLRLPRLGLLSNQGIEEFVRDHLGDLRLEDLQIPTRVVTTNLLTGRKEVFDRGPIAPIVRASCSIPQIFGPVEINGGLYADGGVLEYLPLQTLRTYDCTVNVGVNVGAYADFSQPPRHMIGMMLRVIGVVAKRNARLSARHADVLLEPDLSGFGSFDLGRAAEMIEVGYRCTENALPQIEELMRERVSLWGRVRARIARAMPVAEDDEV